MALTTLDTDLSIIAALDDEPNDSTGLTPAQAKAKFDEGSLALQTFLNGTHIPELDAVHLPYIYGAATTLQETIEGLTVGVMPDASVTTEKLYDGAATIVKGGHGGTTAAGGIYNLIGALSAITPVSADKFAFLDADESTSGFVTLANLLVALRGIGLPQIASGAYTGSGACGAGNPTSITTGFSPKFIYIIGMASNGEAASIIFHSSGYGALYMSNAATGYVIPSATASSTGASWYAGAPAIQMNTAEESYIYFAIG